MWQRGNIFSHLCRSIALCWSVACNPFRFKSGYEIMQSFRLFGEFTRRVALSQVALQHNRCTITWDGWLLNLNHLNYYCLNKSIILALPFTSFLRRQKKSRTWRAVTHKSEPKLERDLFCFLASFFLRFCFCRPIMFLVHTLLRGRLGKRLRSACAFVWQDPDWVDLSGTPGRTDCWRCSSIENPDHDRIFPEITLASIKLEFFLEVICGSEITQKNTVQSIQLKHYGILTRHV